MTPWLGMTADQDFNAFRTSFGQEIHDARLRRRQAMPAASTLLQLVERALEPELDTGHHGPVAPQHAHAGGEGDRGRQESQREEGTQGHEDARSGRRPAVAKAAPPPSASPRALRAVAVSDT